MRIDSIVNLSLTRNTLVVFVACVLCSAGIYAQGGTDGDPPPPDGTPPGGGGGSDDGDPPPDGDGGLTVTVVGDTPYYTLVNQYEFGYPVREIIVTSSDGAIVSSNQCFFSPRSQGWPGRLTVGKPSGADRAFIFGIPFTRNTGVHSATLDVTSNLGDPSGPVYSGSVTFDLTVMHEPDVNLNDRVVLVRKSPEKITLREPYEFQFSARVGQNVENPERLKWVIHSGALPPGISLDRTTGVVSGVVAEEAHLGSYTVVIAASISGSGGTPWLYSDDHEFTLDVVPPPPPPAPVIETDALESGWAAEVYGPVQLLATSDVLPLDWSATSGLPAGLVVSADGVISGTIDDQAAIADSVVYTVTLQVTDAIGQAAMRDVEMTVNPELRILTGSLPVAVVAERYGATLEGVGGSGEYEWTWGGALPTGLRIILTRLGWEISGTPYPEDEGTHAVSVTMTDAENGLYSRTASFTLDILSAGSAPLRLITTYLAPANEGESYFLALESSGGEAPYDLSGTTGLPHGLSVSGGGTSWYITGKPEIAGEYAVTVALRDAAGEIQTTTLTLLVYTEPLGDPDREPGDPDAELGIAPGKTLLAGSAPAGGCALGMESRREQNWLFVAVAMGFIAAGVGRRFSRRRAAASNA